MKCKCQKPIYGDEELYFETRRRVLCDVYEIVCLLCGLKYYLFTFEEISILIQVLLPIED